MTIHEIEEWFQCAARLMFAAEHRGEHSFYPCQDGPSCPWPCVVSFGETGRDLYVFADDGERTVH